MEKKKTKIVCDLIFPQQQDNTIKWASRWDYILVSMPHTNIQWFRSEDVFYIVYPKIFLSNSPARDACLLTWSISCFFSSIMNSLVIVLFLSGMVAMIMLRTLHKDIARYNQVDQVKTLKSLFYWSVIYVSCSC